MHNITDLCGHMMCSMSEAEELPIKALIEKQRVSPKRSIEPHILRQVPQEMYVHYAVLNAWA